MRRTATTGTLRNQLEEFEMSKLPNIVLVHGAWADGSSWSAVIERLQRDGFNVTAPQFALTKLSDDVARLREVLARHNGPTIVAGHSDAGHVIAGLGGGAPCVAGLSYVPPLGHDHGERPWALLAPGPPIPPSAPICIASSGSAW